MRWLSKIEGASASLDIAHQSILLSPRSETLIYLPMPFLPLLLRPRRMECAVREIQGHHAGYSECYRHRDQRYGNTPLLC